MNQQLETLVSNLASYRDTVDQIFAPGINTPKEARTYFLDVLISTSRLYLDYVLLTKMSRTFKTTRSKKCIPKTGNHEVEREMRHRERYRKQIEEWPFWSSFETTNAFSDSVGLKILPDYVNTFALHLPEIYEETIRVEECTKSFITNRSNSCLAMMEVGMEHLGRNHISFVQQALQWAAQEFTWKE